MAAAATRGRFITLEGPDGSGKTTAARHLTEWLRSRGLVDWANYYLGLDQTFRRVA